MSRSLARVWLLMAYAALLLPAVVHAAIVTMGTNTNSPLDWVTQRFAPRRDYQDFLDAFGPGDTIVMSWPGCRVDNAQVDRFADLLRRSPSFHDERGRSFFYRVTTGREVLGELTGGDLRLPREDAIRRLRGALIGTDGRMTCIVVTFLPSGLARRGTLVPQLHQALSVFCGVPLEDQHFAGPVIDGWSVDCASQESLDRLGLPSGIVVFLACWWSLGSWRAAIIVFGASLYAQAGTLATIYYFGDTMNALSIVLPPLVQSVAVAGGIHVANYYFRASPRLAPADRVRETLRAAWLPCVLSAATTIVGVGSLLTSQVAPIRSFGGYSAIGVALATALAMIVVPTGLAMLGTAAMGGANPRGTSGRYSAVWSVAQWLIGRHYLGIATGCVALMAFCALGLRHLESSVRVDTLFPARHRVLQDYAWLEAHVGPLIPIEVLLRCDERCGLSAVDRVELVERISAAMADCEQVGATISAASFMPPVSAMRGESPAARRRALTEWHEVGRRSLIDAGLLRSTPRGEVWRVTGFVGLKHQVDSQKFLAQLQARLASCLYDAAGRPVTGTSLRVTGIMPLVHDIQAQLMNDLGASFTSAFVMIGVAMTIAQGSFRAGLVAMVPNVFPVVVVLGILGWLHVPLDVGSIMTASIALGIAVDDTLHFLNEFEGRLDEGLSREAAVWDTYRHCGDAMINASLVLSAGMAVFALADFLPASRFAWLMATQLGVALLGDVVLLPALLLSPVGRLFDRMPQNIPQLDTVLPFAEPAQTPYRRAA